MTRDELIEKVAIAICESRHDEFNWWHTLDGSEKHQFKIEAASALDTIFDALKEPTNEMKNAWNDDMSDWIDETIADPFHPWMCMLNASPLAKEG